MHGVLQDLEYLNEMQRMEGTFLLLDQSLVLLLIALSLSLPLITDDSNNCVLLFVAWWWWLLVAQRSKLQERQLSYCSGFGVDRRSAESI